MYNCQRQDFILHSKVMQGGLIAVILILYIVLKRRTGNYE